MTVSRETAASRLSNESPASHLTHTLHLSPASAAQAATMNSEEGKIAS